MSFSKTAFYSGALLCAFLFVLSATPASAENPEAAAQANEQTSQTNLKDDRTNGPGAVPSELSLKGPAVKRGSGAYIIGYELIDMPLGDKMGLAALDYLVNVTPWLRTGIGLYGSAAGQYGGFFTGGVENQIKINVHKRLYLDTGFFLGGGGGGAIAGQGGGLMLRGYAGVVYDFDRFSIGAQLSRVSFPNGKIESTQAGVTLELPFGYLYTDAGHEGEKIGIQALSSIDTELKDSDERPEELTYAISAMKQTYFAHPGGEKNGGRGTQRDIGLTGFNLIRHTVGNRYGYMEASGASGGGSDGYAEAFFGQGLSLDLPGINGLSLIATGMFGAGGGGHVSTGGGIMLKASAGLMWRLSGLVLGATGGYVVAPFGDFHGAILSLNAGFTTDVTTLERGYKGRHDTIDIARSVAGWSVRTSTQTYVSGRLKRKAGGTQSAYVNLITLKIDRMLSTKLYLTGQGLAAYSGRSGGYAVGLVGVGWKEPLTDSGIKLTGEMLVGAAGGGGLDVGGGAVVQPMAGVIVPVASNFDLIISGGWIKPIETSFNAYVADVAISYSFGTAGR